ncbi:MAG: phosphoglycerate kinase [Actinomycetota bacterium]|nr:phosphoglycerate kinase [Actinomycetota bacterium]
MKLRTLDDLDVAGKRVLLRADFNVPLNDGEIVDDMRIRATLPTIAALRERRASQVIVCSHLGRPKGKPDPAYTLAPIADRLTELLNVAVPLAETPLGPVGPGAPIFLLENLRFDPGEEANEREFSDRLASLGDLYVDDAFGAAHRAHASVVGLAERLPSAAGLLLQKEVSVLSHLLEDPARSFLAIVGGAKVSDKLPVLSKLLEHVDRLAIGGAMCFTFFAAQGFGVGRSLMEPDQVDAVRTLMHTAGDRLLLPVDVVVAEKPEPGVVTRTVPIDAIPEDLAGYDVGSQTCRNYVDAIRASATVFWNGPMGVFEVSEFDGGTRAVAAGIAKGSAFSVVGGGDSGAALEKFGYVDEVDHVSTGGGASLEFLEGKTLPGLVPLLV